MSTPCEEIHNEAIPEDNDAESSSSYSYYSYSSTYKINNMEITPLKDFPVFEDYKLEHQNNAPKNESTIERNNSEHFPQPESPKEQSTPEEDHYESDNSSSNDENKPMKIEAMWIEKVHEDMLLFYDEPNGKPILPSNNAYYPPVKRIVYDEKGNAFKAHYPKAYTNTQKMIQKTNKFNRKVLKPISNKLSKLGDKLNRGARKMAKGIQDLNKDD